MKLKTNWEGTFMENNGKWMANKMWADGANVCSVQVGVLNMIKESVTPIKTICLEVDGETVRPTQSDILENVDVSPISMCSTDVGWSIPLGEEYIPNYLWEDKRGVDFVIKLDQFR